MVHVDAPGQFEPAEDPLFVEFAKMHFSVVFLVMMARVALDNQRLGQRRDGKIVLGEPGNLHAELELRVLLDQIRPGGAGEVAFGL